MRYLKKVQVSALGGTGTIVDSLVSGSDPATNAPSIRAVNEKLGADNLLFNGDFICQQEGIKATAFLGWQTQNGAKTSNIGMRFDPGKVIDLYSPFVMPAWASVDGSFSFPFTVSIEYSRVTTGIQTISTSFDSFFEAMQGRNVLEIGDGVNLNIATRVKDQSAIALYISSTAAIPTGTEYFAIRRVKIERGSTATPIIPSMRDAALLSAAQGAVAGLKVFEFSGTLPADTSGYVAIEGETGYNLSILAAYCYNVTDAQYYEMAKPDVVGASYYRPTLYAHGNLIRIQLDATSVTNYASQAYKIFALGWRA